MDNEEKDAANVEGKGDESERILEDAYLSGAVGMGTTPRLSASILKGGTDDGESYLFEDDSWQSHAIEEGEPDEAPVKPRGIGGRLLRWMGR